MKQHASIFWLIRKIRCRIPALLVMTAANVGSALLGVTFALDTRSVINGAVTGTASNSKVRFAADRLGTAKAQDAE